MASKLSQLNFSKSAQYLKAIKILWFGHITTKHRSQVSKFHSNFICQFFFLLAMATKAVVAWSVEEVQLSRGLWLGGCLYEVGLLKRGKELF